MSKQTESGDKTGYKRGRGPYSKSPPTVKNVDYDKECSRPWGKDDVPGIGDR